MGGTEKNLPQREFFSLSTGCETYAPEDCLNSRKPSTHRLIPLKFALRHARCFLRFVSSSDFVLSKGRARQTSH